MKTSPVVPCGLFFHTEPIHAFVNVNALIVSPAVPGTDLDTRNRNVNKRFQVRGQYLLTD